MTLRVTQSAAAALLVAAFFASSAAHAQSTPTLKIGDKAPALTVGKWMKGEPVTEFKPGTVYVIECWATWCGPCIAAIPHVTELQHKYKDKVVVIGQNVWEEDESKVQPFLDKMGDKMDYRVVLDTTAGMEGGMAKNWLAAAGRNGIPCSFIVDGSGKVAWIGHPMGMDKALGEIVEGKFDTAAFATEYDKQQAEAMKQMEAQKKMQEQMAPIQAKLQTLVQAKDIAGAFALLDETAKGDPSFANQAAKLKFNIAMSTKSYDAFYGAADSVLDAVKDDAQALNQLAWQIATNPRIEKRDLAVAQKFAERGVEVTQRKDPAVLDTLARIYFDNNQVDKAIATQTEALGLVKSEDKGDYETTLAKYKAAKK